MSQNPYSAPRSDVGSGDDPHRRGSGVKAVTIGVLVDIGGSMVIGTLVGLLWLAATGTLDDPEAAQLGTQTTGFVLTSLAIGLACTVLGAYVAARIANHSEYRYALLVGASSIGIGILMTLWDTSMPLWATVAGFALAIPCALAGGYLRVISRS